MRKRTPNRKRKQVKVNVTSKDAVRLRAGRQGDLKRLYEIAIRQIVSGDAPGQIAYPKRGLVRVNTDVDRDLADSLYAVADQRGATASKLLRAAVMSIIASSPQKKSQPGTPKHGGIFSRMRQQAEDDAANRVPVLISFTWDHDHIPHGVKTRLRFYGCRRRGPYQWYGRMPPTSIEEFSEVLGRYSGTLQVTGSLGDDPPPRTLQSSENADARG